MDHHKTNLPGNKSEPANKKCQEHQSCLKALNENDAFSSCMAKSIYERTFENRICLDGRLYNDIFLTAMNHSSSIYILKLRNLVDDATQTSGYANYKGGADFSGNKPLSCNE